VAYDVTVVSPLLRPILTSTARTPGHAVIASEQRKASLYTSVCPAVDIHFVLLAQKTCGGWSRVASHQIFLIADRQSDRTRVPRSFCRNALFRAISVATQRSISRGIIDRSESPNMPLFYHPVPASVTLRVPSCLKDLTTMSFRLNKMLHYYFTIYLRTSSCASYVRDTWECFA
jgi:hypothetical protein